MPLQNGLVGFVESYIDAYNGLYDHNVEYSDLAMKSRLLQNSWNLETAIMVDILKASPKSFDECCHALQNYGIRTNAFEVTASTAQANATSMIDPQTLQAKVVFSQPRDAADDASIDSHSTNSTITSTERIILNALRQQRQGSLPQGYSLHGNLWRRLSPQTQQEFTRLRTELLGPSSHLKGTPTGIPPPEAPAVAPLPTPSAIVPMQYTAPAPDNAHVNLTESQPMDPDDLQILSLLTTAMQNDAAFYNNDRYSYCTRTLTVPLETLHSLQPHLVSRQHVLMHLG